MGIGGAIFAFHRASMCESGPVLCACARALLAVAVAVPEPMHVLYLVGMLR